MPTFPSTTECPWCGARLRARYGNLLGRRAFCGYEECGCAGARDERARVARATAEAAERERADRRAAAYARAGIAPRFATAEDPRAGAIAEGVARGRGAYVCGPVGTGKTHLACAAARILVDGGTSVRVTDMLGVLSSIRDSYGGGGSEGGVLSALAGCGCLVIDDLGKEAPSDWALSQIFRVVNDRYAGMRPVIVTTQHRRSELARRLSRNGDAETARAIVSRLAEMCDTYELTGRDRRLRDG